MIRFSEWPSKVHAGAPRTPGSPCFEALVEGHLVRADLIRTEVGGEYAFDVPDSTVTRPGEASIVGPRKNEIHGVHSPVRSETLHVSPDAHWTA